MLLGPKNVIIPYIKMNTKNKWIMGIIADKRKFKPTKEQNNPTNPTGNVNQPTNEFDIDESTIKDQQKKK